MMKHTISNKNNLIARIRKIKGQLGGVEKALEQESDCFQILQQISAAKGALQSLMNEVLKSHINEHLSSANTQAKRDEEVKNLLIILKSYMK